MPIRSVWSPRTVISTLSLLSLSVCHHVEAWAGPILEKTAEINLDMLSFEGRSVSVSHVAVIGEDAIAFLDVELRTIFKVSSVGKLSSIADLDSLGLRRRDPVSGIWFGEGDLLIGIAGREPHLVRLDLDSRKIEVVPTGVQVMDLDLRDPWMVVTPAPGSSGRDPGVLVSEAAFTEFTTWGTCCPHEFDRLAPMLRHGCMNRVAIGTGQFIYLASLNSGRCEKINLDDSSATTIRESESAWTAPRLTGDNRVAADLVLLDIAASRIDDTLFILTSPKGRHGTHSLEVYRNGVHFGTVQLDRAYGTVEGGPGGSVVLVAESRPSVASIYKLQVIK